MVRYCCVIDCNSCVSSKKKDVLRSSKTRTSFYRFPIERNRYSAPNKKLLRQQRFAWLAAVKRKDLLVSEKRLDSLRICQKHFASGIPSDFRDVDNPDWVPHLHMGYETSDDDEIQTPCSKEIESQDSFEHENQTPCSKEIESQDSFEHENYCAEEDEPPISVEQTTDGEYNMIEERDVGTQTHWSSTSVNLQTNMTSSHIAAMEAELLKRNEEIYELRARLAEALWTEEAFKNDDKKVTYYSGLPSYKLFRLILDHLEPALSKIKCNRIDAFQKLLLSLMKLRCNLTFTELAYRFRISVASVSTCFRNVIVLISYTFQGFVHWPDREPLRTAMPRCFKEAFGNSIAVIIDCFEIPTERPANAKARAKSFSNYKNNYTANYLLGITPHGFVSFISEGWGGRASDKFISEHSGLLDNLLPGDVVMSDRGFTIKESVSMQYAELLTPEFLHNKMQLAPQDVEKTRKIASVRVHVERIIGLMKNK